MDKILSDALDTIQKRFGEGAIRRLGDSPLDTVEVIPTGCPSVDSTLGIGGIPRGRIVEIYGPEGSGKTTFALHAIAEAQALGGVAAFIDVEHAFDAVYAGKLGVDIDNLFVAQPDCGEQALETAELLAQSAKVSLIVIDSVAALVTQAEINGEMGDAVVGQQARLMSQACRKLTPVLSKTNTALLFINQLREKIGVMWGCFNYNARVTLADGTTEKIGKLVNTKSQKPVLSYNIKDKCWEEVIPSNYFINGKAEVFRKLVVKKPYGNGKSSLPVTDNHLISTPDGYKAVSELVVGDLVNCVQYSALITDEFEQFIYGSLLGDGSLRIAKNGSASLRFGHGKNQENYIKWKHSLIAGISNSIREENDAFRFETYHYSNLAQYKDKFYVNNKKEASLQIADTLGALAYAIWYLDDGTFDNNKRYRMSICAKSQSIEFLDRCVFNLNQIGINCNRYKHNIVFPNKESCIAFNNYILPFVPTSMEYKSLLPINKIMFGHIKTGELQSLEPQPIIDISNYHKTRSMRKFDMEIPNNGNYVVDGVLVHNSPETTSGGKALKFYASMRIDIRRIGSVKDGDRIVGNRTKLKTVKNRFAAPFREVEFDLIFGEGFSKEADLLEVAIEKGIIKKSGAWFSYKDSNFAQGKEKARIALKDKEFFNEVKAQVQ